MNEQLDIATVKKIRGSELLAYGSGVLSERASRIASLEDSLIRIGQTTEWLPENASTHDWLCAGEIALKVIVAVGKDEAERIAREKEDGKKPAPMNKLVEMVINAIRQELIARMTARLPKEIGGTDANEA